jgi:hypothetical protein
VALLFVAACTFRSTVITDSNTGALNQLLMLTCCVQPSGYAQQCRQTNTSTYNLFQPHSTTFLCDVRNVVDKCSVANLHQLKWTVLEQCYRFCSTTVSVLGARGGAVGVALGYEPEGRGFDFRCYNWNFPSRYEFGVDSVSNRNEYQKYFLGLKVHGS